MISVENLYWILYQNLLKPVGLDCYYYYPFGTTKHFSGPSRFQPYRFFSEHHVLFHFDQEPLWDQNLGSGYEEMIRLAWTSRLCRILANSEHSSLKKNLCQHRNMLDWYFFYHGLAALDWYRDARFIDEHIQPTKVFSSMNHIINGERSYRMAMTARLLNMDLAQFGDVSFHGSQQDCLDEIQNVNTRLSMVDIDVISRHMIHDSHLPLWVDSQHVDGRNSAHFGQSEYQLWQKSAFHLVNETVFYESKIHLTEKIFKPIVSMRPFMLVSAPGNLTYLKNYGFQTFSTWIDESYDVQVDHDRRLDMIAKETAKLCEMPWPELKEMLRDMQPVLEHNKQHFFGEFKTMIINEMIDNFDTCIRLWNNCRLDGRELPLHPNLASVKKLFLL